MSDSLDRLMTGLEGGTLARYYRNLFESHPDLHMKDATVEAVGPDRAMKLNGRWVTNFGSDSSLGLDQHPRVIAAAKSGIDRWGMQIGSSRAFSKVATNHELEERIAAWMGTEAALVYPSVTLTNHGALPALTTRRDAVVCDQYAHHCVQQGMKLAGTAGAKTGAFAHNDPDDLVRLLKSLRPYRSAIVAIDGVYSMTGTLPPLRELRDVAAANDAVLYVDDAHATGLMGTKGRGTVYEALGDYDNVLVVGSLSKALSCAGGFVACPKRLRFSLAVKSGPLIFGGPVPPNYLDAACAVMDILEGDEYEVLRGRLRAGMNRFLSGMRGQGLPVGGGVSAIAAVPIGEETATLKAGRELFEAGYYVQSVIFPAVPHNAGLLRVQINASHTAEAIDGLVGAISELGVWQGAALAERAA